MSDPLSEKHDRLTEGCFAPTQFELPVTSAIGCIRADWPKCCLKHWSEHRESNRKKESTMTKKSESINELAAALSKAQAAMEGASKDSVNPHFKSNYADLGNCWEACRKALTDNGLGIVQIPSAEGANVTVTTILTHSSGQFIEGSLSMIAQKNTPQGVGSCITYARRYALSAFVGIAPEDDDGQAASQGGGNYQQQQPPSSALSQNQLKRMFALMNQSSWDQVKLKAVILEKYGIDSSRKLSRQQYDEVCNALIANPKPPQAKTVAQLKEEGQIQTGTEVQEQA